MRIKVEDVARAAQVSRVTVSRVLNGGAPVNARTAERVREAMRRLGYEHTDVRPGPKPRQSRSQEVKNGAVALIVIGRTRTLLEEPIMARVIGILQDACARRRLSFVLDQMDGPDHIPLCVQSRQVAGALLMTTGPTWDSRDSIAALAARLPAVHVFAPGHVAPEVDHVTVNDVAIGALAFRAAQSLGCRSFALVDANPTLHEALLVRGRAFIDQAVQAGLPVRCFALRRSDSEIERCLPGRVTLFDDLSELPAALAQGAPPAPTGVFLTLEKSAAELHRALDEAGHLAKGRTRLVVAGTTPACVDGLEPRPLLVDLAFEEMVDIALDRLLGRIRRVPMQPLTFLATPKLAKAPAAQVKIKD